LHEPHQEKLLMKIALRLLAAPSLAVPLLAGAHTGHGMDGVSHWHATDTWGLVAVAVLMALAWWSTGRK
jgi:hypothetical protein